MNEDPNRPTLYVDPVQPANFSSSNGPLDNNLRLVSFPATDSDPNHFDYTPLIQIRYGFSVDLVKRTVTVNPLYIGHLLVTDNVTQAVDDNEVMADGGGTISLSKLEVIDRLSRLNMLPSGRPQACTILNSDILSTPSSNVSPFPYDKP